MIKAKATLKDDRPLYLFGLSERNLHLLKQGHPISIKLEDMGGSGEVLILFGDTEADITRELAELIGPDTVVSGLGDVH